jgi:pre-mycofactocin synthase
MLSPTPSQHRSALSSQRYVVKALALGARAVMIGRAYLWGLSANGQACVENGLDILRSGIDSAVLGLGHSSIHDLTPGDLLIPPGFDRGLSALSAARRDAPVPFS